MTAREQLQKLIAELNDSGKLTDEEYLKFGELLLNITFSDDEE